MFKKGGHLAEMWFWYPRSFIIGNTLPQTLAKVFFLFLFNSLQKTNTIQEWIGIIWQYTVLKSFSLIKFRMRKKHLEKQLLNKLNKYFQYFKYKGIKGTRIKIIKELKCISFKWANDSLAESPYCWQNKICTTNCR